MYQWDMAAPENLQYIINHIFLPPKLPQKFDGGDLENVALLEECERAWESFQTHLPIQEYSKWAGCGKMLRDILKVRDSSGAMIPDQLDAMLESMSQKDVLALHIRAQNAGLIIRKMGTQFCFESFELSPTNKAVMSTKGRLQRYFSGPAISVGEERVTDPSFRDALVQVLTSLDVQTPQEALSMKSKQNLDAAEVEDTVHPKFVTEMLSGILRGLGSSVDVLRIEKRTRDDVLWEGAEKPWRRSPLWLLVRVTLQTSLATPEDSSHIHYKSFMIFLMARILQRSLDSGISSELLFIMNAKISRRLLKLGDVIDAPWVEDTRKLVEAVQQKLAARWAAMENNPDPFQTQASWNPSTLCPSRDTTLSLQNLGPYLRAIPFRDVPLVERTDFAPQSHQRIAQSSINFPSLNTSESGIENGLWLADIEMWVEDTLATWLEANQNSQNTTTSLSELIECYTTLGRSNYVGNPEAFSLMLLTAIDLWVALDKSTIRHCSMLSQYSPEFPEGLFDPLLLPKRVQMQRLNKIEEYLRQRRFLITSSLFQSVSFASQFYEQSRLHQLLRRRIEVQAQEERALKSSELRKKKQRYQELMVEAEARTCEYETRLQRGRQESSHSPNCRKCQIKWEANKIEIKIHEWPLPIGELATKTAAFELEVPTPIADWRNATYLLLVDVFSPPDFHLQQPSDDQVYYMKDYSGLTNYSKSKSSRLQLASSSKSLLSARYPSKPVSDATENTIFVNNGLTYSMYDTKLKRWTNDLLGQCNVRELCTLQLPPGPYQQLQFSLAATTHSSNEILAKQSSCPESINLHEFYAFATFRSGNRLQWRNMARELVTRILNFSLEETHLLVCQAIWEVGKSGDGEVYRDSHADLKEEEFAMSFLVVLNEALAAVEGSWQGSVAVRTFVAFALRILSLSQFKTVQSQCFLFLKRARSVALQWMRQVLSFLDTSEDLNDLTEINTRVLEMALTCHSTFDVEPHHATEILSSAEDIPTIIECSVTIHDHCPAVTTDLPQAIQSLLERFSRRSHGLELSFRNSALGDQQGIDNAIRRIWSGYRPSGAWSVLPAPNERWLVTNTVDDGEYCQMTVLYNILTGSLLVNGLPLTRLPEEYQLHDTYRRLFGDKVLAVVPSSMAGMEFETRSAIFGQQIHFSMIDSELIIRTRNESQVYELIPLNFLAGDFPKALVQDYTHFLDVTTGSVEWRPINYMWEPSHSWIMRADTSRNFSLFCDGKPSVDIRSKTAQEISCALSALEQATHIHIFYDDKEREFSIHLPRYKLDFTLKKHGTVLESKQFRGMAVDMVQSVGTLTGLVNKLVLRSIEGTSRMVVVPQGEVSFARDGHHVRVMINIDSAMHVQYHSYVIDNQLGRLVDNGNLQSRLFRTYLHATTSHCLIDQLNGRTGTEEALDSLASAATRSFVELEPPVVNLLESIARLSPQRQFYPESLRESQQVEWLDIPSLSQHGRFQKIVRSIFDQARSSPFFQDQPIQTDITETRGMQHLLDRAAFRDSSFRVHGYGAECHTSDYDVVYANRDQVFGSSRELQACHVSRLVDNWTQNLAVHPQLLLEIESWDESIHASGKEGPFNMGFDMKWLDEPSKFLPTYFYGFHHRLSHASRQKDKYKVMMMLSTLAYSGQTKQELVQTLLAFATVPELRTLPLPDYPVIKLSDGYLPQRQKMSKVVETYVRPFHECPESQLLKLPGETRRMVERRREDEYHIAKQQKINAVSEQLMQAPSIEVSKSLILEMNSHIMVDEVVEALRPWFDSWQRNAHFKKHVEQIQAVLNQLSATQQNPDLYTVSPPTSHYALQRTHVRFEELVEKDPPQHVLDYQDAFNTWVVHRSEGAADHTMLKGLLDRVTSRCSSRHDQRYSADLRKSYQALRGDISADLATPSAISPLLGRHKKDAQRQESYLYETICKSLEMGRWRASRETRMLPRLSKLFILSQLTSDKISNLSSRWRKLIIQYAISITILQRAERLLASAGKPAELLSELRNPGHQNWNPSDHPEWLLMEIENNILIREEQSQVAREMISPSSGSNSLLQLSMGLGKSSVIVPIAAATLADRTKMVRAVVLKPLAMQMFNLLSQKLGGLLNRRIFCMPVTRSLKLDKSGALQIHNMLVECMQTGGILLMQPEHILSFELMGFERLLSNELELGSTLIKTQEWLQDNSCDIIDESDEILSVKYELIYTMGTQQATEFSPNRWNIIQGVLSVLGKCALEVQHSFPGGLEVISSHAGAFPKIRILKTKAGDALIQAVALQVCETGIPGVPVWRLPRSTRNALYKFLVSSHRSPATIAPLQELFSGSESVGKVLLLLKGIFGKGVLRFCLEQKRWRVHYGLHLSRSKLAVPYQAKDLPAPRAEFSHPDATIVLTCLSYYYGGLSDEQMLASFEALLQSDHASEEYAYWVQDNEELPHAFRQLTGVNLGNLQQCRQQTFPPLRFTTRIINFYMSNMVFPAEMKEFQQKLSSSGWDIARQKRHPTTGFSGTNDSRYHLPLSISQRDLPQQLSTNAEVLCRLLKSENIVVDISRASNTGALDAAALIKIASMLDPPARVILDVGAQVLELQNEEMAGTWLSSVPDSEAQAVIFFDSRNDICVLSRDGSKELLEVSPFLKQMDACLVYLDEAHTRGTDLKMPANYRALVTLGPGLTKDRLAQACMRMRKLGEGQSVAFCSSTEIRSKILDYTRRSDANIEVIDVLEWCIANTCSYSRRCIPLWATQGLRYQRRHVICSKPLLNADGKVSEHLVRHLPEQESQSLQERYGDGPSQLEGQFILDNSLQGREQQVAEIQAKCEEFDVSSFNMANLYEEQERELSPENEREKQIDRPPVAIPRKHTIHADVQSLATHGVLKRSDAFQPAFDTLRQTSADNYYEKAWPEDLLVTTDFAQTVQGVSKQFLDSYLRPVNWIISCKEGERIRLIILSPFEVQELLPLIRKQKRVRLHIYAPCLNLSARKLEDLSYCAIPPMPRHGSTIPPVRYLNIFAGQLYIRDYAEYIKLCGFLGLLSESPEENMEVRSDGFVVPSSRGLSNHAELRESAFRNSPVEFLRRILEIRRKGQSFVASHMGMILNGELISREKFKR